jgi:hypothetical protein
MGYTVAEGVKRSTFITLDRLDSEEGILETVGSNESREVISVFVALDFLIPSVIKRVSGILAGERFDDLGDDSAEILFLDVRQTRDSRRVNG